MNRKKLRSHKKSFGTKMLERQYVKGHKQKPENAQELNAYFKMGLSSFDVDKWLEF